jgi:subtilisin
MYFSKFYQKPLHILNILVATVFVLQTLLFPFMLIEASAEGGSNLQNDSSQVQVDKDDTPSATPDPADDNNSDSNTSDKSIEDQNQESSETDDQTSSENKTSSDNSEETENIDQTIQEDNSDDSNEQTDETESSKATSEQTEPCTEFTLEVFRDKWDGNKFQQVETKCVSYEELTNGFDVYQLIKVDLKEQMKHAGERFSFRLTSNSQTLDNNLYYLNTQGLKGGKYKIFIDNQDTAERKTIFDGDVWKYDNQVVSRGYDSYGNENVKFVLEYTDQHVNQESKDFKFFIEKKDQETYGYALNDGQTCNQDAFTATYFKDIQKLNPGNQNRDNLSHDNLLNKPFDQITDYTQEEGYVSTRCETNIDYNWGESSPHKLYNIGSKKYGVRYSKDIPQDKLQDKYTFNLTAKDYHRLVFNNQVVSAKFDKKVHEENKTVELTEEDKQQDSINLTFEHIFRQVWNGHEGTLKLNVEGEETGNDDEVEIPEEYQELYEKVQEEGSLKVIASFKDVEFGDTTTIQSKADQVNADLNLDKIKTFRFAPGASFTITQDNAVAAFTHESIQFIEEDSQYKTQLTSSNAVIKNDVVHNNIPNDYRGRNTYVAVIDTGSETSHPFLANLEPAYEACFTETYTNPTTLVLESTSTCPSGADSEFGPGSSEACVLGSAGCEHGTHVAGIAAGINNGSMFGVASEAGLISINTFAANPANNQIRGLASDAVLGLEHVWDLRTNQGVNVVATNMSLAVSANNFSTFCNASSIFSTVVDNLKTSGVASVAASGNDSEPNAIGDPACIDNSVAVGSTNDSDVVSNFSNNGLPLDLYAPGEAIESSLPGGVYGNRQGTSMATPHVSGAFAVLQEAYFDLNGTYASVDVIENALKTTGTPVTRDGITRPRIDVCAAAISLGAAISCNVVPGSISGVVWDDYNGDGIRDTNEPNRNNTLLGLFRSNGSFVAWQVTSTVAGVDGVYEFNNLLPGDYQVRVYRPGGVGYSYSPANQGNDDTVDSDFLSLTPFVAEATADVSVSNNSNITNIDSGIVNRIDLQLTKTVDNSTPDEGDNIEYRIRVRNGSGAPGTNIQISDILDPGLSFSNIISITPGTTYDPVTGIWDIGTMGALNVRELRLEVTVNSGTNGTIINNTASVLNADQNDFNASNDSASVDIYVGTNFGIVEGIVWDEIINDGIFFNEFHRVRAGIVVGLYDNLGNLITTTTTNVDGYYIFPFLTPGDYQVVFEADYYDIPGTINGVITDTNNNDADENGETAIFPLAAGQRIDVGAGYYSRDQIGGRVWNDQNGDNGFDLLNSSDVLLNNWTVNIYQIQPNGSEVLIETHNTVLGGIFNLSYISSDVPKNREYIIEVVPQPNFSAVTKNAAIPPLQDSVIDPITYRSDPINIGNSVWIGIHFANAGFRSTSPTTSIGDQVFTDTNGNGIQDAGEPGLDGVTVELLDLAGNPVNDVAGNPIPAQTTTTVGGTAGFYRFENLVAGTYLVRYTLPNGSYIFSPANQGVDDDIDSDATPINATQAEVQVTVNPNDNFTNVDAGLIFNNPSTITGRVWDEFDDNGIFGAGGETIRDNISVELIDNTNTVVQNTVTDPTGNYTFSNVTAGDYTVRFATSIYDIPGTKPGTIADVDNNDANEDGVTDTFTLNPGQIIDVGLGYSSRNFITGRVWNDTDIDDIYSFGDPFDIFIGGFEVRLYQIQPNGTEVAVNTYITDPNPTGAQWSYETERLPINRDYIIEVVPNVGGGWGVIAKDAGATVAEDSDINPTTFRTDGINLPSSIITGGSSILANAGFRREADLELLTYTITNDTNPGNTPQPGDTLRVRYETRNNGPAASPINSDGLIGFFPAGLAVAGSLTTITDTVTGNLNPNDVGVFEFTFVLNDPGVYPTTMNLTMGAQPSTSISGVVDPDLSNNFDTLPIVIGAPDLTNPDIVNDLAPNIGTNNWITCNPNTLTAGDTTTCSGTVPNNYLPGTIDVQIDGNIVSCTIIGQNFVCPSITLINSGNFDVLVDSQNSGNFVDSGIDVNIGQQESDLEIFNYTVSDQNPMAGDTVTVRFELRNNGPFDSAGINSAIIAFFPAGLGAPGSYNLLSDTISAGLVNGATGEFEFEFIAGTQPTYPNTFTLQMGPQHDMASTLVDPNPANNFDSLNITIQSPIPSANLSVTGTSTNPTPAAGDTFDYQITLTNNGPDTIAGIDLENILSAGQTFVSSSDPSYNPVTGIWNIPSIPAGTSITLTITVSVDGTVTYGTPLSLGSTVVVTTPAQYTETNPGDEGVNITSNSICPAGTVFDGTADCVVDKICPNPVYGPVNNFGECMTGDYCPNGGVFYTTYTPNNSTTGQQTNICVGDTGNPVTVPGLPGWSGNLPGTTQPIDAYCFVNNREDVDYNNYPGTYNNGRIDYNGQTYCVNDTAEIDGSGNYVDTGIACAYAPGATIRIWYSGGIESPFGICAIQFNDPGYVFPILFYQPEVTYGNDFWYYAVNLPPAPGPYTTPAVCPAIPVITLDPNYPADPKKCRQV